MVYFTIVWVADACEVVWITNGLLHPDLVEIVASPKCSCLDRLLTLTAWNSQQPFFYGCFNWMIPNQYIKKWLFRVPGRNYSEARQVQLQFTKAQSWSVTDTRLEKSTYILENIQCAMNLPLAHFFGSWSWSTTIFLLSITLKCCLASKICELDNNMNNWP